MNFGLNLKLARIKAGMLQNEVAAKVGITQAQYSRYERGEQTPSVSVAVELADALGVGIEELTKRDESEMKKQNTVTIYYTTCYQGYSVHDQGSAFSLKPWGEDTSSYKGYDDGGKEYILPDGYEVAKNVYDERMIFGPDGKGCELMDCDGLPCVLAPGFGNREYVVFKPVND